MTGSPYTDELQRAIRIRTEEISRVSSDLRGAIPTARVSLHKAFGLLDEFPNGVRALVQSEVSRAPDAAALAPILETILRHLTLVADFIEKHLAHGGRHELSQALSDDVAEELDSLGLAHYNVILSHGEAANFATLYGDIDGHINGPIGASNPGAPAADRFFALFSVPRIEGAGIYWKPILIGHEVAHVHVTEQAVVDQFDLSSKFDFSTAGTITSPRSQSSSPSTLSSALFQIAQDWTKEFLCDAHALHRYGPAAIPALGEYFATIGGLDAVGTTHPPGWLRIHLMIQWLGAIADPRLRGAVQPWLDHATATPSYTEDWARFLADLFVSHSSDLHNLAASCPAPSYDFAGRTSEIHVVADRLAIGIAGSERRGVELVRIEKPDVVNAAWIARSEDVDTQIDGLARKALENISFVDRWIEAGGALPTLDPPDGDGTDADNVEGALSQQVLMDRLVKGDSEGGIVATPLLQLPKGSALDLRLGARFIVFRRTGGASFDPLDRETDPRSMQVYRELSWTEQIVLHPHELLLAATLEYLVLPSDLTAQVITRSSYGRLGLLSATAVQVHPNFHGCLTLELVNLSNLPLVLTPGERIAQLVAWKTAPVEPTDEKYHCPVGPEFSKARIDDESELLRAIRQR